MESKRIEQTHKRSSDYSLLIEPVWNRNYQMMPTSDICDLPFNRTSMESKPEKVIERCREIAKLLIEPVWNRNPYDDLRDYNGYTLLIEPVWN